MRVGSGVAKLSVLKWLAENGGWEGKRVLVIHSGGDSKRVPVSGKPHVYLYINATPKGGS